MKFYLMIVGLALLVMTKSYGGEVAGESVRLGFVKEQYLSVSFADLKKAPEKLSGQEISVRGYLARDYDIADVESIGALYEHPFSRDKGISAGGLKLRLPAYYASVLFRYGFSKKCTIYGVYLMTSKSVVNNEVSMLIRIEGVEGEDGTNINFYGVLDKHGHK
jgi:hypothetical protein